jgi:hypothetical protein
MRTSYFALQLGDLLGKVPAPFRVKPATDHKSRKRRDPAVRDIAAEGALYCAALSAQRAGARERGRGADISKRLSPPSPYHSSVGNTVSLQGQKFASVGDKFKFVSVGDNALYSKNPFRFHKESCCYAARARGPNLSRRYDDEPLAWVWAYADASTERALQVTMNALTYVCFYSHFTNVSTIAYSAPLHKRPMPLQVFVFTSLQKFNLRLPTPQYSIASLCLDFATC